ncbi:MAG: hypothetical protein PWQ22_228 [Archaeoglobaceae archaeon]|nr:hypothetical protein [Archaeoglobaceae archaeon]
MEEILKKITDYKWELSKDYKKGMRVPAYFYISRKLMKDLEKDAVEQAANVATMPGIRLASLVMPDVHVGYGFPIGGVAGFDLEEGVISPITLKDKELDEIFISGAKWALENGYGVEKDLERCEENGAMPGARAEVVSRRARDRGRTQLGTLGSGNHFLEVQYVEKIYNPEVAKVFGLEEGTVTVMIHCGSRGLGHQVCTDFLEVLDRAVKKYNISLPDRQLACAPIKSREGEDYFAGMAASANFAWCNRQIIAHWVRESFRKVFKMSEDELGLDVVYDVAHNIAKIEEHRLDGKKVKVCVHRKGATRAFSANRIEVPTAYRDVGQPVLIPGSMGTPSYVLVGTEKAMEETFGSTCHGSGRVMSRAEAKRKLRDGVVRQNLEKKGIYVRSAEKGLLAEEAPEAYKISDDVVDVVHRAGISTLVAKLIPLGVTKG